MQPYICYNLMICTIIIYLIEYIFYNLVDLKCHFLFQSTVSPLENEWLYKAFMKMVLDIQELEKTISLLMVDCSPDPETN